MITVSQSAMQQVLEDIRNGVTYPDFWTNRYGEEDEETTEPQYKRWWEENEEEAAQA